MAWSQSNAGNSCGNTNDSYLTFTPAFSGQARVLLNNRSNCSATTPASINVLVIVTGGSNTLDNQTAAGANTWVGHIYDGTNATIAYNVISLII
jgi:hypothetical protein